MSKTLALVRGHYGIKLCSLYFEGLGKYVKGRQGNLCSIASVLSDDYNKAFNKVLMTKSEYEAVAMVGIGGSR
jgi:hypothetical protein